MRRVIAQARLFHCICMFGFVSTASSSDYYVSPAGSDSNAGTDAAPFRTIQKGINTASNGDVVLVKDGIYTGTGNVNLRYFGKAITVQSVNGPEAAIIDCQSSASTRGVSFQDAETSESLLRGLTIRNGTGVPISGELARYGGGIACIGASPTIESCTIKDNECIASTYPGSPGEAGGAGILVRNASPIIRKCVVTNNRTEGGQRPSTPGEYGIGSGIFIWAVGEAASPRIETCSISNNLSTWTPNITLPSQSMGAGIAVRGAFATPLIIDCRIEDNFSHTYYNGSHSEGGGGVSSSQSARPVFESCTIQNNVTSGAGGGVFITTAASGIFHNCSISSNSARTAGGGIYNSSMLGLVNTTISDNLVSGGAGSGIRGGGGLYLAQDGIGNAQLLNCTVAGNQANQGGGGGIEVYTGHLTVKNSILAHNLLNGLPSDAVVSGSGSMATLGHNHITVTALFPAVGDVFGVPIELGPLQDNGGPTFTHSLPPGSPAIDTGDNDDAPSGDQRAYPRPYDGDGNGEAVVDKGAVEVQPAPLMTVTPAPTPTISPSATPSPTRSPSPTPSPTPTVSPSPTPSTSPTQSATATPSPTPSPSASATPTPTSSPVLTASPSVTPSPTQSPTTTQTAAPTPSSSPSPTASATISPSPSLTPSASATPSPTSTPTSSPTPSPTTSATATSSPSPSQTATPTATSAASSSPSPTPSPTLSPSPTPSATPTPSPTPAESLEEQILNFLLGLGGNPEGLDLNGDGDVDIADLLAAISGG